LRTDGEPVSRVVHLDEVVRDGGGFGAERFFGPRVGGESTAEVGREDAGDVGEGDGFTPEADRFGGLLHVFSSVSLRRKKEEREKAHRKLQPNAVTVHLSISR
jgi:hypothetical protein